MGHRARPDRTPSGPNVVSELATADVTARFPVTYDVAYRRCDLCERCGKAPVSKALRIKDPVEGAFDSPSNLLAVCDACYSAARGRCPCRAWGAAGLDAPPLSPVALGMAARPGDKANGLGRRLTQSAQSPDLRTYEPLSSRVEMYSVVQSSPVAPTALFDCAT
jgi:hypothetical protein